MLGRAAPRWASGAASRPEICKLSCSTIVFVLFLTVSLFARQTLLCAQSEDTQEDDRAESTVERIVLFTAGGPIVVEMTITIDGRSLDQTRDELSRLMYTAARGEEAEPPDWSEGLRRLESAFEVEQLSAISGGQSGYEMARNFDRNRNRRIEPSELRDYLTNIGLLTRGLTITNPSGIDAQTHRSPCLDLLDRNRDRVLSGREILEASARLKTRDAEDDDLIYPLELGGELESMTSPAMSPRRSSGPRPGMGLGASADWGAIYYSIDELYQTGGRLDAACFPMLPALVPAIDENGNGEIERAEITGLATIEPHVGLVVQFDSPADAESPLTLASISTDLAGDRSVVTRQSRGVTVQIPGLKLRFVLADGVDRSTATQTAQAQFKQLDANSDGYLVVDELPETFSDSDQFAKWDANADDKLYPDEFLQGSLHRREPLRAQLQLRVDNRDDAVFSSLDTSNDGRLGQREIETAPQRLLSCDRNHDARLTVDEFPASFLVSIERGPAGTQNVAAAAYAGALLDSDEGPQVPRWFGRMDYNGDGEISLREFLGTRWVFESLDTNGDRFLDAGEATTADASVSR